MANAELTGSLQIKPAAGSNPQGSNGCQFGLSIRNDSKAPARENSSGTGNIDSAASFVALPVDTNMRGKVLYLRTKEDGSPGPFDVRITQLAAGQAVISGVKGLLVIEVDPAEYITAVELQGVGQFEWALFGASA